LAPAAGPTSLNVANSSRVLAVQRDGGADVVRAHDGSRQVQKPDHGAVGEPCAAAQKGFDRAVGLEPGTQRGVRAVYK
jgi:hypothetical protein